MSLQLLKPIAEHIIFRPVYVYIGFIDNIMAMMDLTAMRNFKDFLMLYNEISETCFRRCAGSTINRELSSQEEMCVNNCAGKYVNANHRIMEVYVQVQSALVNKRMEEFDKANKADAVVIADGAADTHDQASKPTGAAAAAAAAAATDALAI